MCTRMIGICQSNALQRPEIDHPAIFRRMGQASHFLSFRAILHPLGTITAIICTPSVKDLTKKQLRDKIVAFLELGVKAKEHAWESSDQRWNGHSTNNGKLVDKCARI